MKRNASATSKTSRIRSASTISGDTTLNMSKYAGNSILNQSHVNNVFNQSNNKDKDASNASHFINQSSFTINLNLNNSNSKGSIRPVSGKKIALINPSGMSKNNSKTSLINGSSRSKKYLGKVDAEINNLSGDTGEADIDATNLDATK